MRAIVIGAGIGGLAVTQRLVQEGVGVVTYEQAPKLEAIGAGINITPNGTKALQSLGLDTGLRKIGVAAEAMEFRDLESDESLLMCPLQRNGEPRYGAPMYSAHRGELQQVMQAGLPEGTVRLGERCLGVTQGPGSVTAHFESGRRDSGDVLIGADGVHSTVRKQLPGSSDAKLSHVGAWRTLIPTERLLHLGLADGTYIWWGAGRSVVMFPVSSGKLWNFVGIVPVEEVKPSAWPDGDAVGALRRSLAGCNASVRAVMDEVDYAFVTQYFLGDPLPVWSYGRMTLLGDAAHPMHPFLAQGGCQAIEDAVQLGTCVRGAGTEDVPDVLARYEECRLQRTAKIQAAAIETERRWHLADADEITLRRRTLASLAELDPHAVWSWMFAAGSPPTSCEAPRHRVLKALGRIDAQRAWETWEQVVQPAAIAGGVAGLRESYEHVLVSQFAPLKEVAAHKAVLGGVACLDMCHEGRRFEGPVFLHLHGGGYVLGSARTAMNLGGRLARAGNGRCVVVDYRLAPETAFPGAVYDAMAVYVGLLEQGIDPARIVLTGEGSGGGLALAMCLLVREQGHTLPAGIAVMSPLIDLTLSSHSLLDMPEADPLNERGLLSQLIAYYLQGTDPRDPLASPIYGDLIGFPALLVQASANEALIGDARRLTACARATRLAHHFEVVDSFLHAFQTMDYLSEANTAIEQIARYAEVWTAEAR